MTPAATFDGVAAGYDRLWTETAIGRAQRASVWRVIDELFAAGDHVLDVGCGTGVDAAHLAARGIDVQAVDASPAMVEEARRRGVKAEVVRAENVGSVKQRFDGVLSNFGALNCVVDLTGVVEGLAQVVRPGGHAAICVIGRFCLRESVYFALRGRLAKASRRWKGHAESSLGPVHYWSVAELREAFAPHFQLERWSGVGVAVPPSFVAEATQSETGGWRMQTAADRWLERTRGFRGLADHRLLVLVRK